MFTKDLDQVPGGGNDLHSPVSEDLLKQLARDPQEHVTYRRYCELFSGVPGWFEPLAVATWDVLLEYQETSGIHGNLLEIGVWKGRSAAMMALHARQEELCVLVDWSPLQEPMTTITQAIPNVKCIGVRLGSDEFRWSNTFDALMGSVRWLHIDAGRDVAQVCRDLEIADKLITEDGVISVDDFFTPAYPQVAEAVFWTLYKHYGRFALFLSGFNKCYLCRPAAAQRYLTFIRDRMHQEMVERGCGAVTFWKTNRSGTLNAFGVVQAAEDGRAYRGLDTDHDEIQI